MKRRVLDLLTLLSVTVLLIIPSLALAQTQGGTTPAKQSAVDLRLAMRSLWGDHIFWVRNVVLTTKLGDTDAAKAAENQVVQNAKEIANAVVPFYGKAGGEKLFTLLAGHYAAIKDYMTADFAGNKPGMDSANSKMVKNAEDIASFLSSANPNWPRATILSALNAHAAFHMAQIQQINAKDFSAEAKTWESMKAQVYQIADVLAEGLVKQFAQRFAVVRGSGASA